MRRALCVWSRTCHVSQYFKSNPNCLNCSSSNSKIIQCPVVVSHFASPKIRFFSSSENDDDNNPETSLTESAENQQVPLNVKDVSNKGKFFWPSAMNFSGNYLSIMSKWVWRLRKFRGRGKGNG